MAGKSGRLGIVALYDVKGVTLVVLKYAYEGVVAEGGSDDEMLVGVKIGSPDRKRTRTEARRCWASAWEVAVITRK